MTRPLNKAKSMPLEPAGLNDWIGFLPGRQAENRKNPMRGAVPEIVVTTETGGTLRILSNDLDAPAKEIAALQEALANRLILARDMKPLDSCAEPDPSKRLHPPEAITKPPPLDAQQLSLNWSST